MSVHRTSCAGPALPPVRTAAAEAALAGPVSLTMDGLEVTQAIQNMDHKVPLVAAKKTIARVYLSATASGPITVRGVLRCRNPAVGGTWVSVPSVGAVIINPAENNKLRLKRESITKSLNFVLPEGACKAGACDVQLARVERVNPSQGLAVPSGASRRVKFVATPPLRVRVLGIRFRGGSPPAAVQPSTLDFALIQSWLARAYPAARVIWSQTTVDGPHTWPFVASQINAFVRGVRATEVSGGTDARTHYYGLVADGGGSFFMRGLASGIPSGPDPSTVASGPTGSGNFGWDNDGSYGDWYTGHEYAHTFGRFHAEFCGAGGGKPYPFDNGQLANADGAFVGFDVGDAAHNLPMQALPGTVWHDVMTYCTHQWISSFTYSGIRDRLVREDTLPSGGVAGARAAARRTSRGTSGRTSRSTAMSSAGAIHVVATINLTRATGELRHITPVAAVPAGQTLAAAVKKPKKSAVRVTLRCYGEGDRLLAEYPAAFIPDACREEGDDETGSADVFLPHVSGAARLELVLNGKPLASFAPGPAARAVRQIRAARPAAARAALGGPETQHDADPVLTWTDPAVSRAALGGAGGESESGRTYTVEISSDNGQTWQTVGFGLREPRVVVDRHLLAETDKVKVRVTSTDGFQSASSEKTLKVSEL